MKTPLVLRRSCFYYFSPKTGLFCVIGETMWIWKWGKLVSDRGGELKLQSSNLAASTIVLVCYTVLLPCWTCSWRVWSVCLVAAAKARLKPYIVPLHSVRQVLRCLTGLSVFQEPLRSKKTGENLRQKLYPFSPATSCFSTSVLPLTATLICRLCCLHTACKLF